MGAAQESPRIKTEAEEPQPDGPAQGDGARGAQGWVSLSQDSKEKALFLPGGGEERGGEGRREGRFLGGSCGERWRLTAGVGRAGALPPWRCWGVPRLPLRPPSRTASEPTDPLLGVQFEAAVGASGRWGEAAALSTSVLSQPSPPPRSLCSLARGGPETGRWLRRSSPPGPR